MRKLAAVIIAFSLIFSSFAYAGSTDFEIGVYTIVPDGKYDISVIDAANLGVYFNDKSMAGSCTYLTFVDTDLPAMFFDQLGLEDYTDVCDYYIDAMCDPSKTIFASIERSYAEYGDVACVTYHGDLVESSGGGVYSGVVLGTGEGMLFTLILAYENVTDQATAIGVIDTFLSSVYIRGEKLISASSAPSGGNATGTVSGKAKGSGYSNATGSINGNDDSKDSVPERSATASVNVSEDSYVIGNSIITPPSDWEFYAQDGSQVMFTSGDIQIIVGTYALGEVEIEGARSLSLEEIAALLTYSTQVAFDALDLDSSSYNFSTTYYDEDDVVICFSGDATPILNADMYMDGAAMLTDSEIGMIMVFSDGSDPVTADKIVWQGVSMFLN